MTTADLPRAGDTAQRRVRAWDGATRLFHWSLVLLIVSAYVTRNYSNDPTLYLHRLNGYAILTLLLFRLLWGAVGSSTSSFASFFPWPSAALRYARSLAGRRPLHYLGHNPLGGALILLMLGAVAAQALTGLFTSDDTLAQGPLYDRVSDAVSGRAGSYHAKGFWIIAALATVHILANLAYQLFGRDKLIKAMVTGTKPAEPYVDAQEARLAPTTRAIVCLLLAAAIVAGGVLLAGGSLLR